MALADPRPERLGFVLRALAAAPAATLQLAITPDVGWEGRAARQLDRLGGSLGPGGLALGVVSAIVGELFHLFYPEAAATAAVPRRARRQPPAAAAAKTTQPAYRAELRLRVSGSPAEARSHAAAIVAAFRTYDGANALRPARVWSRRRFDRAVAHYRGPSAHSVLGAEELAGLFHLGGDVPGFASARVRLASGQSVGGRGKVICLVDDGRGTPAAISAADGRHHIHVLGPTGSGKSTLLLNLVLDDVESGRGVGVIDPKGDLVRAMLERIPRPQWDRVVLLDPSLRERPVGLNVIECDDPDRRELVCDQLVTIFRKTYERSWGPRTDDLLRAAVLTLLHRPGSTLCEVPLLLLRPEAQRDLIDGLGDPVGLGPFWDEYRRLSDEQRLQMVGPVLNKLRAVLMRGTVRNVLGQSRSTIDLAKCMDHGGVLLISLAKGLLGEETSRLLGGFLVARLWQTAMARAGRSESARPDFVLYVDEFQNYVHLPQSLDEVLAEARGYHLGLVLAHQHLGQLSTGMQEALAANARTRVVFQCGQDDARTLAREFSPWLGERELRNLARYQVAVRLCQDGRTERPFTGMTRGEPPSLGLEHAAALVAAAVARDGRDRAAVEHEIEARMAAYRRTDSDRQTDATERKRRRDVRRD